MTRLGHRVDAEDRIALERRLASDVLHAVGVEVDDFPVAVHQRHDAGELFFVDDLLHDGVHSPETFGRDADRFRRRDRQIPNLLGCYERAPLIRGGNHAEHHDERKQADFQACSHGSDPQWRVFSRRCPPSATWRRV